MSRIVDKSLSPHALARDPCTLNLDSCNPASHAGMVSFTGKLKEGPLKAGHPFIVRPRIRPFNLIPRLQGPYPRPPDFRQLSVCRRGEGRRKGAQALRLREAICQEGWWEQDREGTMAQHHLEPIPVVPGWGKGFLGGGFRNHLLSWSGSRECLETVANFFLHRPGMAHGAA